MPEAERLPTWDECRRAVELGRANPLQLFIFDNMPAGDEEGDAEWYASLLAAITYHASNA